MENHYLWSLRLGFSTKEGEKIKEIGLANFLDKSFKYSLPLSLPEQFDQEAIRQVLVSKKETKTDAELTQPEKEEKKKAVLKLLQKNNLAIRDMILRRAFEAEFPLKENIALFWHNHFVSTMRGVRNAKWIFDHYSTLQRYGTGNYKDLVKQIIASNAMIKYLNNDQNKKGKINENLGRELLELFTLGEGHYSESDIKNTARALAGLSLGASGGMYRPKFTENGQKELFGEKGDFKLNDVIDIIFKKKEVAYFITRKIMKWFIYDNPPETKVEKYGDILRQNNYDLEPFFKHLFLSEEHKAPIGSMMKNPLKFAYQVLHDLNIQKPFNLLLGRFLKNQGMEIYDQINVEGWQGGKDWLSSHIYVERQGFVDVLLSDGKGSRAKQFLKAKNEGKEMVNNQEFYYPFSVSSDAATIINSMIDQHLSIVDEEFREELNKILIYDFDPKSGGAQQNVNRLYQYITSSPEFQII